MKKKILNKTYRMCSKINSYCHSYIKKNIKGKRQKKEVIHLKEGGEIIEDYIDRDLEKVLEYINKDKFVFVLFRTNYYKRKFIEEVLVPKGIIYHEIRGESLWNSRTINLYNACYNLVNKQPLNYDEVKYLIKNLPFKYGLLKRGLKSKVKDIPKKEKYFLSDLMKIGFNMKIYNFLTYTQLFNLLDVSEKILIAFKNSPKNIKELPIKLKIGTIHSSKGKEADEVILFKDINYRVANEMDTIKGWDDEIRLFYVASSRAREKLVILRGGFERSESDIIP